MGLLPGPGAAPAHADDELTPNVICHVEASGEMVCPRIFVRMVRNWAGTKITESAADVLIAYAQATSDTIGGTGPV